MIDIQTVIPNLWPRLSPASQSAVGPLLSRWDNFEKQIRGRSTDVYNEAGGGLDQVMGIDATNTGAISAAFTAVEARVRGLTDKVQEAEEKLSEAWDEATDDLDAEGAEQAALAQMESTLVEKSRGLQRELETQSELLAITKQADWAKRLYDLTQTELAAPRECAGCAAPLTVEVYWQAANITCAHCGAVGLVNPGPATGLYFQGAGVHHLSREAAKDQWLSEQQAEHWFKELRLPTEDDFQRYLGAAKLFWDTYHNAFQHYHPNWGQTIEAATAAKMAHYTAYEQQSERTERARNGQLVALVGSRDPNGLGQFLSGSGIDADEAARAPYERGDFDGAAFVLSIGHRIEGANDPIDEYIAERMADLAS